MRLDTAWYAVGIFVAFARAVARTEIGPHAIVPLLPELVYLAGLIPPEPGPEPQRTIEKYMPKDQTTTTVRPKTRSDVPPFSLSAFVQTKYYKALLELS